MMNYAYPCAWHDGATAALMLVDLPLVPVVLADGTHALALTGGGMDLSWEICRAYVALGFLPPLHYCRDLPRLGNRPKGALGVLGPQLPEPLKRNQFPVHPRDRGRIDLHMKVRPLPLNEGTQS